MLDRQTSESTRTSSSGVKISRGLLSGTTSEIKQPQLSVAGERAGPVLQDPTPTPGPGQGGPCMAVPYRKGGEMGSPEDRKGVRTLIRQKQSMLTKAGWKAGRPVGRSAWVSLGRAGSTGTQET